MKGSKLYFLMLGVFVVLVFLFQYYSPKKFVWHPTFSHHDRQPFGSYVFDDVVSSSVDSYQVQHKSLFELYIESVDSTESWDEMPLPDDDYDNDDDDDYFDNDSINGQEFSEEDDRLSSLPEAELLPESQRRAILVAEQELQMQPIDVKALFGLLRQGNKVMLCASWFSYVLGDSLWFSVDYDETLSISRYFERSVKNGLQRDRLYWGPDTLHAEQVYSVYPNMHPVYLKTGYDAIKERYDKADRDTTAKNKGDDMKCDMSNVLVCDSLGRPVVIRALIGEGELFLVTTPLMFTNYGILDGNNASYVFRLLSYMDGMPLIRLQSYGRGENAETPLRYFLSEPSLRWALYVALITILLFMFFTAKRRQRVIPVVKPPANETLRFTSLIGNLFYQRKDYKNMLKKKYLYFCTDAKRLHGLNLQSGEAHEMLSGRLAKKTGMAPDALWPAFRELMYLLRDNTTVDEAAMIRCIEHINEWKRKLS